MNFGVIRGDVCVVIVLVAVFCLGCGTGEYRERVERGLTQSKLQAEFDSLQPPKPIGDTPFTIRPPKLFKQSPDVTAETMVERTFAPFGALPEGDASTWSYEGFIEDGGGGKMPFYLATAVRDMEGFEGQEPFGMLRTSLEAVCGESLGQWETVTCRTPQGGTVEWKKIRGTAQQEFYYTDGKGKSMNLPMAGLIEVYARNESGFLVVLGWRMPTSIEQNVGLDDLGPKVAGTLDVGR